MKKAKQIADMIARLTQAEVAGAISEGFLPPSKMKNVDFMEGVAIGISLTMDRHAQIIPLHLRKLISDTLNGYGKN
jgi:hypothetical protein